MLECVMYGNFFKYITIYKSGFFIVLKCTKIVLKLYLLTIVRGSGYEAVEATRKLYSKTNTEIFCYENFVPLCIKFLAQDSYIFPGGTKLYVF